MIILGIGAKARQGKDLAASAILDWYSANNQIKLQHGLEKGIVRVQRIGFADELYRIARDEYGMKEKDAPLLQRIGANMRNTNPRYWIDRAFARINPITDLVIIPDTRYYNEACAIRDRGGYTLKITRLTAEGHQYIDPSRPADHISETELDNYPFDFEWKIAEGHQALTGELAITLAEYLRGLGPRK